MKIQPLLIVCTAFLLSISVCPGAVGDSQVANWKDNKTAAFLLMFDDSCNSHYQVAIPELVKRNMIGTFYLNPGKGEYKSGAREWEEKIPLTGMVYGDHTMDHQGAKDFAHGEWEIGECARIVRKIQPGPEGYLLSWAMPGVGPGKWNITKEELQTLLDKYNLVSRPPFDAKHGVVFGLKTTDEMLALADKAIAEKGMEYIIVHGLERRPSEGDPDWKYQDFWALNKDVYRGLLDGLAARRDTGDLWITDHISQHKYQKERDDKPAFQVLETSARKVRLKLAGTLDSGLYDLPLTVTTEVPAGWKAAMVTQGVKSATVPAIKGIVQYDALPNGQEITLTPATVAQR